MIAAEFLREFSLPPELEAHEPPEARGLARDQVRLLVSRRLDGSITHAHFSQLPDFLRAGDLLVVNASATLAAALEARTVEGRRIRLNLSTQLPGDLWVVEPRDASVREGERLILEEGAEAKLLVPYLNSRRLWIAKVSLTSSVGEFLRRWGRPIGYPYLRGAWPLEFFQTVYATEAGSAEMTSAGRPFTLNLLAQLKTRGIGIAPLLLHTGVASPERDEPPYEEWFDVPAETAAAVKAAKKFSHRVVAVGTTVVRALESALDRAGRVVASRGWTNLVITPERGVCVTDALLTGFHEPKSTHLGLLEAFAGRGHIQMAYQAALSAGYLWHEFGDSHLIL